MSLAGDGREAGGTAGRGAVDAEAGICLSAGVGGEDLDCVIYPRDGEDGFVGMAFVGLALLRTSRRWRRGVVAEN